MYICMCMYICMHVCMYVCMYVYKVKPISELLCFCDKIIIRKLLNVLF